MKLTTAEDMTKDFTYEFSDQVGDITKTNVVDYIVMIIIPFTIFLIGFLIYRRIHQN